MKKLRIFVGPVEVAGYYSSLAKGFRSLGCEIEFATFADHPFNYGGEDASRLVTWIKRTSKSKSKHGKLAHSFLKFCFFIRAIFKFDIFIFGFGHSIFKGNKDLPLLKLLGKRFIFCLGHGSEMRPPYLNGAFTSDSVSLELSCDRMVNKTKKINKRLRLIEKYADHIVGAPFSSSQFSQREFINFFELGLPHSSPSHKEVSSESRSTVRIVHAPSNPVVKGTLAIKGVIEGLKDKGFDICFVELINRTNSQVLEELSICDFVVDQLYSDTPMPGLAAEAASFGKPCVVAGYELDALKSYISAEMWPPSLVCHPDDLSIAVEKLCSDASFRINLGSSAYEFVRTRWSAENVARKYLSIANHEVPRHWLIDPKVVKNITGCGVSTETVKLNCRKIIEMKGISALCLNHRPDLEDMILDLVGDERRCDLAQ